MTVEQWLGKNELSQNIFNKKYKDNDETLDEFFERVSHGYEPIKKLIQEKKFLFGGRILANRGVTNRKVTYSNCYVISPPEDNLESIFECASKLARTYSYGGGCGIDLSKLRPKGASTNNAAKESTGPISFMDIYSQVTGTISQNGRRGALMISLDINHPDVDDFIDCKTDLSRVCYANISVRVNDEFMKAVENDSDYFLGWPCGANDYNVHLDCPYNELQTTESITGEPRYYKRVKAKQLFDKLVYNNWDYAEPGILYWDRIQGYNMLDNTDFKYAGVNPCAEEPLPAGGSCLLGSINLAEFVKNPFTKNAFVDFDELEKAVYISVVALNQVLIEGLNFHPLQEQRTSVGDWRQIGLGTMGLADMLIKMGVKYGSKESLDLIDSVYKCIATAAVEESLELAKSHGCYAKCDKAKLVESNFIKNLNLPLAVINGIKEFGLFNSQLLTCAPTGSIATMLEVSTGVEPNFALNYTRKTQSLDGKDTFYEVNAKIVEDYKAVTNNVKLTDCFVTSGMINPIDRVKVQSILQKYTDASISSTVNLAKESTVEDVYDIYMEAWKQGLKGITVYRSGCKREGILIVEKPKEEPIQLEADHNELPRGFIVKAGDDCIGLKRTLTTGCGTLHVEAFFDSTTGELLETYLSKGSKGGCNNYMIGLSRMMSLAARGGVKIDAILDQLKSCGTCPSYAVRAATKHDTSVGSCCPVAVGNALRDMHNEIQERLKNCVPDTREKRNVKMSNFKPQDITEYEECPECHHKTLIHSGGCVQCVDCGWSKCN